MREGTEGRRKGEGGGKEGMGGERTKFQSLGLIFTGGRACAGSNSASSSPLDPLLDESSDARLTPRIVECREGP